MPRSPKAIGSPRRQRRQIAHKVSKNGTPRAKTGTARARMVGSFSAPVIEMTPRKIAKKIGAGIAQKDPGRREVVGQKPGHSPDEQGAEKAAAVWFSRPADRQEAGCGQYANPDLQPVQPVDELIILTVATSQRTVKG